MKSFLLLIISILLAVLITGNSSMEAKTIWDYLVFFFAGAGIASWVMFIFL